MDGLVNQLSQNTKSFYDKSKASKYDEEKKSFYYEDTEDFIMYGQLSYKETDGKKVYNLDNIRIINEDGYPKPNQETRFLIGDGKMPSTDIKKEERKEFLENMIEVICDGKIETIKQYTYNQPEPKSEPKSEPKEEIEEFLEEEIENKQSAINPSSESENVLSNELPKKKDTDDDTEKKINRRKQVSTQNDVKLIDSLNKEIQNYNNIDDINNIKKEIDDTMKTKELKKIFNNKLSTLNKEFEEKINNFINKLNKIIEDYNNYIDDDTFKYEYEEKYIYIHGNLFEIRRYYIEKYSELLEKIKEAAKAKEEAAAKAAKAEEAAEQSKKIEILLQQNFTEKKKELKENIELQKTRETALLNLKKNEIENLIDILKKIPYYNSISNNDIIKAITIERDRLLNLYKTKKIKDTEKLDGYIKILGKFNSNNQEYIVSAINDAKTVIRIDPPKRGGLTKKRQKKSKKKYIKIPSNMTKHKRFYQKIKTRKHK